MKTFRRSILQTIGDPSGYEIANIEFNGNKFGRDLQNNCSGLRIYGSNLHLGGSNFSVHHVDSTRAMCGTALGINGANFQIYNNWIAYNGRDKFEGVPGEPWADGITLARCDGGSVHDNILENNTDVEIVAGGGNCQVYNKDLWAVCLDSALY